MGTKPTVDGSPRPSILHHSAATIQPQADSPPDCATALAFSMEACHATKGASGAWKSRSRILSKDVTSRDGKEVDGSQPRDGLV